MENPDTEHEQDHSSDSSGPEAPQNVVKTKLQDDEVEVLEEALEDWKAVDSNQRKGMKNAMKAKIKNHPANSILNETTLRANTQRTTTHETLRRE